MRSKYSVKLKKIIEGHGGITALHLASNYEEALVTTSDVNRPALQLTGFYDYFDASRIQIIGRVESTYLDSLPPEERRHTFERFLQEDIAALVFCHGVSPLPEYIEVARKYDRNIFITDEDTSEFQADLIHSLQKYLAPRVTVHGVLVEIYGEGVLLMGDSGIGKSETALELIKRGHRLIADDAVEIRRVSRHSLIGSAPELIRYYMELRGIGVVNVRHLFGMGAVKPESNVDLVIQMEPWDNSKAYDRLGLSSETASFVGVEIPQVTIPVRPGRNLAVIMELAAMNNRQKKMGYNAAAALAMEHDAAIDAGMI
ncbi:MAG: HPr(Ser) kinase/phosphatase [Oscillospiraceae bacterium]|nr:HPr(Ser) kinase/phosphatase [Oscillospiraceae bacterium]